MVCAEIPCTNHANPSLRSGAGVKGQANVSWTPSAPPKEKDLTILIDSVIVRNGGYR